MTLDKSKYVDPFAVVSMIDDESGYIVWRLGTGHNVEMLHIHTEEKGKGYGRDLFYRMLGKLRQFSPYHSVFGFTRADNVGAKAFYGALGFDLTGVPGVYADGRCILFHAPYDRLVKCKESWEAANSDPSPNDPTAVLANLVVRPPTWFVVGGLGDGDEWKAAAHRWPGVKLLGVDVDPAAIRHQLNRGWLASAPLVEAGLGEREGWRPCSLDSMNCSSFADEAIQNCATPVSKQVTTLDALDRTYGPFEDAVLWLDLEGWDGRALRGAENLLRSGRVKLINFEVWRRQPKENAVVERYLADAGFERVCVWFRQYWGHNEVWRWSR